MSNQIDQNIQDITEIKVDLGILKYTVDTLANSVDDLKKMHEDVIREMRSQSTEFYRSIAEQKKEITVQADFNKQLKFVLKVIVPLIIVVGIALGDKVREIITSISFV